MTPAPQIPPGVQRAEQALLELIESDRARLCDGLLGEAQEQVRGLHGNAHASARARMRQAFEEQRARRRERLAAAEARLATERRLHEQQRLVAWLRLASERLPTELRELWHEEETRTAWARAVLVAARLRLPASRWRIAHAADWPSDERDHAIRDVVPEATLCCKADPDIAAGLKVVCGGLVLDGTLDGLLVDRLDCEARLLQHLEGSA